MIPLMTPTRSLTQTSPNLWTHIYNYYTMSAFYPGVPKVTHNNTSKIKLSILPINLFLHWFTSQIPNVQTKNS